MKIKEYSEDELPGLISSWQTESAQWRIPYEEKNLRLYKLYRLYLDLDETYFWESKVFIPEAFIIIWSALPKMIKSMLDQEPYIKIRPQRRDVIEGANLAEVLLTQQFKEIDEQGLYIFLVKAIQDLLIFGNAFCEVSWKYEEAMKRRRVSVYETELFKVETPMGILEVPMEVYKGDKTQNKLEVVCDRPEVNLKNWFDVYLDPLATSLQRGNSRYVITRDVRDEEGIEALKNDDGYKNLDKINYTYDETSMSNYDQKREIDEVRNTFGTDGGKQGKTELLRCQWSRFKNGRYEEWLTIIADGEHVIYNDRTPYFHDQRTTIKIDCFPLSGRMYDIGFLEPAEDLCGAVIQRFNQQADIVTMGLSPISKVKGTGLYNLLKDLFGSTLPAIPGLLVPMESNEDISPLYKSTDIRPSQDEIAYIKNVIEEVTVPKPSKGIFPERKETLGALVLTQNQANERFITLMHIFFYTGLKPIAEQMLALNHQFLDLTELEVKNEQGVKEFREIKMGEIPEKGMTFEPNMAFIDPLLNRDTQAQVLTQIASNFSPTPGGVVINWNKLVRKVFELRAGGIESDDLVLSEDEIAQKQQQLLSQLPQQGEVG